jgi:hypothetical protein
MGSTFVFSLPRAVDSESELISKAPAYTVVDNLSASRLKIPEVNIRFYAQIQAMSLPKFFRLNMALKDCYQKHNHN